MTDAYVPDNINEIKTWVKKFKALMKKCPKNIWFFSNGQLYIMVTDEKGNTVYYPNGGGVNPDYIINNELKHIWEGGDW